MTRTELLEIFPSGPDPFIGLLRRIHRNTHMIAGNHTVSRKLMEAGMIELVERDGQWRRFTVTPRGLQVLEGSK